jgi:hypothetical protein
MPRQAPPNIEGLRAALEQRATQWKAELRAEPEVARLLLRRLVGPMTLWDGVEADLRWEAETKSDLMDGLVHLMASPTVGTWNRLDQTLESLAALQMPLGTAQMPCVTRLRRGMTGTNQV